MYATDYRTGEVFRLDPDGTRTAFASNLTNPRAITFATDGSALFVAQGQTLDTVLRISIVPEPSTLALTALGLLGLIVLTRRKR